MTRHSGLPDAPLPYPDDSPQALAARWVRWLAGFGWLRNPCNDRSGAQAGIGQPSDVWFLGGTFGGTITRQVTVPAAVPLFVPAITKWRTAVDGPAEAIEGATSTLTVDGEAVDLDTIATPEPFTVIGAFWNPVTGTRAPTPVTVWGRWRRLDPLPPGEHVLRFGGADTYGFRSDTTVRLTVA
jgi:hypothetical protein